MKIWVSRLSLSNDGDGNWLSFFRVKTDDKEYELRHGNYYEVEKSWIRNEIPSKIKIRHIASGYLVECGFEYLPDKEELKTVEWEMKRLLNEYIEAEFKQYEANYNLKIQGLFTDSK